MKKKLLAIGAIAIAAVVVFGITVFGKTNNTDCPTYEHYFNNNDSSNTQEKSEKTPNKQDSSSKDSKDVNLDPTSITVLVNKTYTLDESYEPDDLVVPNIRFSFSYNDPKKQLRKEAADAIEDLFQAASEEGLTLAGVSGYRSYSRQYEIYVSNLIRRGIEFTNQYSAMPGASEHQTGLAMDISTPSIQCRLSDEFANTKEGKWVVENSYKYGFILRFAADKTDITGYSYEPWHIRYVGIELATYLKEHNLCLDEYYDYEYDKDIYADIDYDQYIHDYYVYKGIIKDSQDIAVSPTTIPNTSNDVSDFESLEENLPNNSTSDMTTENTTTTLTPIITPTKEPTEKPTPTVTPTNEPSKKPTPTASPTKEPTKKPTPSASPTKEPTKKPTPTASPTKEPTKKPTPTASPTKEPTKKPTPTASPTKEPTKEPTPSVTHTPSDDDDNSKEPLPEDSSESLSAD